MSVVVSYAGNPGRAGEVAGQIPSAGTAAASRADVADEADVTALFDEAERRYGGADVIVDAAGIMPLSP